MAAKLRTIADLGPLRGKRVLVRVDLNVPMGHGRVLDDTRMSLTLPTIEQLRKEGARIVLLSHLKDGKRGQTLAPVAALLATFLHSRVSFIRQRIGTTALSRKLEAMRNGDVVLLENIRSYPQEEQNTVPFARQIAILGDAFVNDAFGVSHRSHASLVRLPLLLPSAAGLLLEREVAVLGGVLDAPSPPVVALIGGAKISTKLPVIERMLALADCVLLGGALVNNFFVARGYGVGASLVEASGIAAAKRLLRKSQRKNLILPIDVVVGDPTGKRREGRVVPIPKRGQALCRSDEAMLDIGPATIHAYAQQLKSAATIVWNGPMGKFEQEPFHHGSVVLARVIATRSSGRAFGIVGGGETLVILARTGMARYIDFISSGGGAMLAFLAGEPMPAIALLREDANK